MSVPPQLQDTTFHLIVAHPKCRGELIRFILSDECLEEVDTSYEPRPLNPRVEGEDGLRSVGDGDLLLRLNTKRFGLVSCEAKSYFDSDAVWQALSHGLRQALHVARHDKEACGQIPGLVVALVMHGKGAKTKIKSLAEISNMTGAWRKAVVDVDLKSIRIINCSDFSREDLSDYPEAGGLLLLLILSDGRKIEGGDIDYLARAWALYPDDMRWYTTAYVTDELRVHRQRWCSELLKVASPEEVELHMNGVEAVQANSEAKGLAKGLAKGRAVGEAKGLAKAFLTMAEQRFPDVPKHLAARVRRAPARRIHAWVKQLPDAPDLESLLNGGINGKPRS